MFLKLSIFVVFLAVLLSLYIHYAPLSSISRSHVNWYQRGSYYRLPSGHDMFYVDSHPNTRPGHSPVDINKDDVVLLIHGFPSSSYDYSTLFTALQKRCKCRVVAIDHLGFGFSSKPPSYNYTMSNLSSNLLSFLKSKGLENVHAISHDMGDTVLTEALSLLEEQGKTSGFKTVTFTNGGMVFSEIGLRLGQRILLSGYGETFVEKVPDVFLRLFTLKQLYSIWSKGSDEGRMKLESNEMLDLLEYNDGNKIIHKLSYYLKERSREENERRWFATLSRLKVPIKLCWGDGDAVAPVKITTELVKRARLRDAKVEIMEGIGHFGMLEDAERWMDCVLGEELLV
mmetsp:Transcript_21776/g.40970  ORF Transcript_21776/g.40970 Transcript_21776/m.40970 type:complete len:342 (-) Transcript_21776:91-1116(-)|eukprot:CAMPEP_0182504074 /NCGR_PEP_ID=MMETSP1321-20130603/16506_1 /TAXON_ID=91990 /ORGANISM="Bolidomonas sp., Strain RCC1657" /LENGTH=341 /DNA_ID=CAMNT_0024709353 /DNA_START=186 /DNA_END=1211 /DNA_ORIENTATION=-